MTLLHFYIINVHVKSCFYTVKKILAVKAALVLTTCRKHHFFLTDLCCKVPRKQLHSFGSRLNPRLCISNITALFSGRTSGGKWHIVIWHESNGFEACLEVTTKDLAPSAGSQLTACMTKSDLICRSVWHFKTQKVNALSTGRERKAIRRNEVSKGELHLQGLRLLRHWSPL